MHLSAFESQHTYVRDICVSVRSDTMSLSLFSVWNDFAEGGCAEYTLKPSKVKISHHVICTLSGKEFAYWWFL